jgi:long-chain acyl-CoA synthetase
MLENRFEEIYRQLPANLSEFLRSTYSLHSQRLALVESSGTWTYAELNAAIERTQESLRNKGVRPGDRVMIVGENSRAYVAIYCAVLGIHAWPVLVNAKLSADEIDKIRDLCGARRIAYTTSVSSHALKHATRHQAEIEDIELGGKVAIGPLNAEAIPEALEAAPESQISALIYTSGTTGQPKGVMLSARNLLFMALISNEIRHLTPEDRILGVLPMTHAVGLAVVMLGALLSGGTLYLTARFDPPAMLNLFEKEKITVALGTPSMFSLLADYARHKGLKSLTFPSLRVISSSGAPLDLATKRDTERIFGMTLHNGYGVTECSPTIALTRIDAPRTDISVGSILPLVKIKLVDSTGMPVPEGEVGELWVHGPNVMRGYYQSPDETAQSINSEGWFNTRDLARLERGNLFIVGRTKDLIVRFGFNVYPAEVESVLNAHPFVVRSAVLGKSSGGNGGEEIVAFVQKKSDVDLDSSDLANFAAKRLTPYKLPSKYVLLAEMPLTPTGKVAKANLMHLL